MHTTAQQGMKKNIAIIEDEPDIVELVTIHLAKSGFAVKGFGTGIDFLKYLEKNTPDLVILDLMLPDIDGLEICKMIRSKDEIAGLPIIMLTAKSEEMDKVVGLEIGADDYITKPFSPKELVARVKAALRRHVPLRETKKIEVGGIMTIDVTKHEVSVRGMKVELTATEFKILELLCSKKGWVFSREKILDYLWGDEKAVIDRTVDVHIRHLREKIGDASRFIKNVRGVGYKLEE